MIDGMAQKRWALTNGGGSVVLYHEPLPTLAAYQIGLDGAPAALSTREKSTQSQQNKQARETTE